MYFTALSITISALIIGLYLVMRVPSLNYFMIIFIIYAMVLRPYAILVNGGSEITKDYFSMMDYEFGYLAASINMFVYVVGMFIGLIKLVNENNFTQRCEININKRLENLLFTLSIISCVIFLYIGGIDILFVNRTTTISMQNPVLRYIFPFVTVLLCASTIHAVLAIFYGHFIAGISKSIVLFVITGILAQRGFFIVFIIIAVSLAIFHDKRKIFKFKSMALVVLMLLTLFSKDILVGIFINNSVIQESKSFLEKILLRPDGDATEVWMLTIQYLKDNNYMYGISIFNNIFNLMPHNMRHSFEIYNGQDILNSFYGGSHYWDYGFGFNVTLPIESYLNFGYFGILISGLAGYIMGKSIVYNYKHIFLYGQDPALASLRLYAIWTITSSFSGFQWTIIYYAIYRILIALGYGIQKKSHHIIFNKSKYQS